MVLEYYVGKGVGKGGCKRYQGTQKKGRKMYKTLAIVLYHN
jgi:hypothetical protein